MAVFFAFGAYAGYFHLLPRYTTTAPIAGSQNGTDYSLTRNVPRDGNGCPARRLTLMLLVLRFRAPVQYRLAATVTCYATGVSLGLLPLFWFAVVRIAKTA